SSDVSLGFQTTTGEIAVNGTCGFNFIPSKVLKDQLPYWKGDLVVSNGNAYRVTIAGTIAANGVGDGLHSISSGLPEPKPSVVTFQLVVPQFQKYTEIDSDYAGVPLQEGKVYYPGDIVVSNGSLYKVITGGTMGPVGLGLIGTATQSLGGLVFEYVGPFFKQL